MKFLLVPLLIVGMFISFAAAMLAMLFWDGSVDNIESLKDLLMGVTDATQLSEEFILKEDRLDSLFSQAEGYQQRYEELMLSLAAREDSLREVDAKITTKGNQLIAREANVGLLEKTKADSVREENLANLAKYYNAMKPVLASETLQEEELSDDDVARIIGKLPPAKAGKILGFMDPDVAARITKIMMESAE